MDLQSGAFANATTIPRRHTCDGDDTSPPLEWSAVPAQTRSLVLLCDDPDAPAGTWHHWAVYDIPATQHSLSEGAGKPRSKDQFRQAINDFGRIGYGGPCPPRGHGPHHYQFRLLALSVDRLALRENPDCRQVESEARKHVIAEALLVGFYQRAR
jgi:Raf kinase inhibitor-like YbhB/YbcL family protein